jgi:hypothetical protein
MAGSGSGRGGSTRSSGGTVSGQGPRFSSDAVTRRVDRLNTIMDRRNSVRRSTPYGNVSRYAMEKRIQSDNNRERQTRKTASRALEFMGNYGSAATFGSRPRLRTRDSAAFNSKPGGRRPRTSRASLTNRRMAASQDAWNRARG